MEHSPQSSDPQLAKFDAWLKAGTVAPPADLLARVRSRLQTVPDSTEEALAELFRPNPAWRDPRMVEKVRQRLAQPEHENTPALVWFKWLTPLAAAATLTFAFASFQTSAPSRLPQAAAPIALHPAGPGMAEDAELTQIFALAVNLHGNADMTKLESVENLAFLFD